MRGPADSGQEFTLAKSPTRRASSRLTQLDFRKIVEMADKEVRLRSCFLAVTALA